MTPKELLTKCRDEKREILILQDKKAQLEASLLPKALSIKAVDVQDSADPDPMFNRIPEVVDLERQIESLLSHLYDHEQQAFRIISGLPDSRYRQLLQLYYLQFYASETGKQKLYTWEMVAEEMDYSVVWIHRMRQEALDSLPSVY